ncbi:FKBP-type peptidyl-prolyl cis-trans isomerase [Microbacterium sp. NPDC055910]|uniref:FKBP-type peptidyl-prolyl cis-trans isomerase n=1 Tax=Microbacterium sp. NPDC055910 TaxID=3345659 RepID=UPI0035D7B40E
MRRFPLIPAAVSVLGLAAVGLVGCTAPSSAACERPDLDRAVLDAVTVSTDIDTAAEISVYPQFRATDIAVRDVVTGEGMAVENDGQLVGLNLTIVNGRTGEPALEQAYNPIPLTVLQGAIPALPEILHCATEGTRTVVALAPGDIEEGSATSIGIGPDDSAVAVIDVRTVYRAKADGADVFQSGFGLPSVVRATNGRPGVTIPDAAPPTEVVVQTIKRGTGPVVTGEQPVRIHLTGTVWETREEFQSTWESEPPSITLGSFLPALDEALEGETVGSQVLVVVPPSEGFGNEAQGAVPANSTLVFVVDILGLDDAPTQ